MAVSNINFGHKQVVTQTENNNDSKIYKSQTSSLPYDTFEKRTANKKGTVLKNVNTFTSNPGFKRLKGKKFTPEEVKQMNDKKELPEGYYLKALNQGFWTNDDKYRKVEDGMMPEALTIVKISDKKAAKLKAEGKFLSKKIPENWRFEADEKGRTYLLSEKHKDVDSAKKCRNIDLVKGIGIAFAVWAASVFALLKGVDKLFPPQKIV